MIRGKVQGSPASKTNGDGRWENGVMKEEWLMWDNQSFMKQVGLVN